MIFTRKFLKLAIFTKGLTQFAIYLYYFVVSVSVFYVLNYDGDEDPPTPVGGGRPPDIFMSKLTTPITPQSTFLYREDPRSALVLEMTSPPAATKYFALNFDSILLHPPCDMIWMSVLLLFCLGFLFYIADLLYLYKLDTWDARLHSALAWFRFLWLC